MHRNIVTFRDVLHLRFLLIGLIMTKGAVSVNVFDEERAL